MLTCSGDGRHVEDLCPGLADICTWGDETHETHSPRSWDPTHLLDSPTPPQPRPAALLGSARMGWRWDSAFLTSLLITKQLSTADGKALPGPVTASKDAIPGPGRKSLRNAKMPWPMRLLGARTVTDPCHSLC